MAISRVAPFSVTCAVSLPMVMTTVVPSFTATALRLSSSQVTVAPRASNTARAGIKVRPLRISGAASVKTTSSPLTCRLTAAGAAQAAVVRTLPAIANAQTSASSFFSFFMEKISFLCANAFFSLILA